ncbi:DUF3267 domain-containing protein [Calidifontibacillus erzurumensis]|uniref:DUF3267 domain-containing protein n=1 Tax=Calidifontibacillus erzurumensis TaxID=2741433 RepID=A0A8J8KCG8_9BACI|nr:DUF3267 domain-containing protein [Calidifontibacillus erzurumensis]NSL51998.1 DUF3267 domain-containing protein [Calidifontibacillus erzurumensis]
MYCWKTINLSRDLGNSRLITVSILTMLSSFIILYVPFSIINKNVQLNDNYFHLFLFCIVLLLPIHGISHMIPIWLAGKKGKINIFSFIKFEFTHSISKNVIIWSMLGPTIFITCPLIFCSYFIPMYMHYLLILAAINIGLSVTDIIFVKILLKAPKKCVIEHNKNSIDILIQRNYHG